MSGPHILLGRAAIPCTSVHGLLVQLVVQELFRLLAGEQLPCLAPWLLAACIWALRNSGVAACCASEPRLCASAKRQQAQTFGHPEVFPRQMKVWMHMEVCGDLPRSACILLTSCARPHGARMPAQSISA